MDSSLSRRFRWGAALAFATCLLVWLARYSVPLTSSFLQNTELRLVDTRFLARGRRDQPDDIEKLAKEVAIVAIDDDATRKLGRVLPRSAHAKLVERLKAAGAKAVVFDVLFIDPERQNPREDAIFAAACKKAGNVFLPFDDFSNTATLAPEQQLIARRLAYTLDAPRTAQVVRLQPPIAPLFAAMRGGGHVATKADSDGKFRSAILLLEAGAVYPHAALDAVAETEWKIKRNRVIFRDGILDIGGHRFGPLDQRPLRRSLATGEELQTEGAPADGERAGTAWMLPLNFAGGREVMEQITIPYLSALDGKADARLKGRIVIVGETATGTPDLRPSPFDERELFLGVQTNATLIANLLDNNFLKNAPYSWNFAGLWLCGLSAALLALCLRPLWAAIGTGILILGFLALSMSVFIEQNLLIEMTAPLLAIAANFTTLSVFRLVESDREAQVAAAVLQETQLVLGQLVDARLAEELTNSPETRAAMQIGVRRDATVMFVDIRGFTKWSETQPPEEVKARLDEYFPVMCEICSDDQDGFIDKFIGDALMVVWNAHKDHPDHATRSVRAALAMRTVLKVLNEGWARQHQTGFEIGIGIASGNMVFGTFGSPRHKLQPTVLGDTVNFASRLQGLTKELAPILISHATFQQLDTSEFEVTELGAIPVRGRSEVQPIYAVLGKKRAAEAKNSSVFTENR